MKLEITNDEWYLLESHMGAAKENYGLYDGSDVLSGLYKKLVEIKEKTVAKEEESKSLAALCSKYSEAIKQFNEDSMNNSYSSLPFEAFYCTVAEVLLDDNDEWVHKDEIVNILEGISNSFASPWEMHNVDGASAGCHVSYGCDDHEINYLFDTDQDFYGKFIRSVLNESK